MKSKKVHGGHKHEIAKAHGHATHHGTKESGGTGHGIAHPEMHSYGMHIDGGKDGMAHHTHHAANAHHGLHNGMAPGNHAHTVGPHETCLGCNEVHQDDFETGEGYSGSEGGAESHAGGESGPG